MMVDISTYLGFDFSFICLIQATIPKKNVKELNHATNVQVYNKTKPPESEHQ